MQQDKMLWNDYICSKLKLYIFNVRCIQHTSITMGVIRAGGSVVGLGARGAYLRESRNTARIEGWANFQPLPMQAAQLFGCWLDFTLCTLDSRAS